MWEMLVEEGRGEFVPGAPLAVVHWENDLYSLCCSVLICEMEILGYLLVRVVVKINT